MTAFILRRLLAVPLIVLAVYTVTFTLLWVVPGNPLENPEGRRPSPEIVAAMKKQYKLDDPVAFYVDYLGKASGVSWALGKAERPFDLGPSLKHQDWTVNEILADGLPVSMTLGFTAILLAAAIGIGAGIIGGLRPNGPGDLAAQGLSLVGISLPFAAYISRLVRFGMIEQMTADYARTARAKGLSRPQVAFRHVLKNAMLPVLSYLGPATAIAATGSFVVERVFGVPGIGQHFVEGVLGKDITLVMGVVLVYSTMLVLFNLAVDVLYRWIDPRIEFGAE